MDANEIRLKCAEAAGWRFNVRDLNVSDGWWTYRPDGGRARWNQKLTYELCFSIHQIPDYPHDLNACAELRKLLTEEERLKYIRSLHLHQTGARFRSTWEADWLILDASAEQHCRAFLAAKGLLTKEPIV